VHQGLGRSSSYPIRLREQALFAYTGSHLDAGSSRVWIWSLCLKLPTLRRAHNIRRRMSPRRPEANHQNWQLHLLLKDRTLSNSDDRPIPECAVPGPTDKQWVESPVSSAVSLDAVSKRTSLRARFSSKLIGCYTRSFTNLLPRTAIGDRHLSTAFKMRPGYSQLSAVGQQTSRSAALELSPLLGEVHWSLHLIIPTAFVLVGSSRPGSNAFHCSDDNVAGQPAAHQFMVRRGLIPDDDERP
jgi:hypothetical protein